jgi:hypothetical protein
MCKSAKVPVTSLAGIFVAYQVFTARIPQVKFTRFLADEVTCKDPPVLLNPELTKEHINMLIALTSAIRNRKTREVASPGIVRGNPAKHAGAEILSDPMMISSMWLAMMKYNPVGATENVLRLAALCRYWDSLDLTGDLEELITALFLYFRQKLDQIDYNQFADLMEAFR